MPISRDFAVWFIMQMAISANMIYINETRLMKLIIIVKQGRLFALDTKMSELIN